MLRSIRNVKFLKCVSLICLSPLFVFYSSLNYDGPRTKAFMYKCCLGVELDRACAPGDKKAQNGSFVGLHAVSHFMPQPLQNVIKKNKKDMPVTEILNTCT